MGKQPPAGKKAKMPRLLIAIIVMAAVAALIIYLVWNDPVNSDAGSDSSGITIYPVTTVTDVANGKILSMQYCQSCHMYPQPELLNRAKWKTLLPQMGLRLGIKQHRGEDYISTIKSAAFKAPVNAALTHGQWQNILDYYLNTAPIKLLPQNRAVSITRQMPFFKQETPGQSFFGKNVLASYVKIDTTVKPARIFVASGLANKLYLLTNKLAVIDSVATPGPVVDMLFDSGNIYTCTIGKELGANENKFGAVNQLQITLGKMALAPRPIFDKLVRPVQLQAADLNGDGKTDYLICEFGSLTGQLSWMENMGGGLFNKHIISNLPGAIKAYFDYSANKKTPDIWVLFAQGEEGIYHFSNNGKGQFKERRVLRFPPIYGSSFFEMVDVDHDGYKDIVYTCGDNGNATAVLKPYHGVYIFMNDKKGNYQQKYFYPLNGCYKAYARDFDGDGLTDIATISLFTDARQPEEGFVFLKNRGGLNFKPYGLPANTQIERCVTMDEGDINGDGKPDLLIGNAFFDFGPFKSNGVEPLFFILKNKAH